MKEPKKASIRPVLRRDISALVGFALCVPDEKPGIDYEVVEWFPWDATDEDIMNKANDMGYQAEWGSILWLCEPFGCRRSAHENVAE